VPHNVSYPRTIVAHKYCYRTKGGNVTSKSIAELATALRRAIWRRQEGKAGDLGRVLSHHQLPPQVSYRLLASPPATSTHKIGRPKVYGPAWPPPWAYSGRPLTTAAPSACAFHHRLAGGLERQGELLLDATSRRSCWPSAQPPSTGCWRHCAPRACAVPSSQPGRLRLRALVPCVPSRMAGRSPGSLQADLVNHCGESTEGFYLTS